MIFAGKVIRAIMLVYVFIVYLWVEEFAFDKVVLLLVNLQVRNGPFIDLAVTFDFD